MTNSQGQQAPIDAADWFARLKEAGGTVRVDAASMCPREKLSPECEAIWNEIRGGQNTKKWQEVEQYVRVLAGDFTGWQDL